MTKRSGQKLFRTAMAALAILGPISNAGAREVCPTPREATALKVAALQQKLMVAALTCGQVRSYNRFVLTYRGDLQQSDAALLAYFRHHNRRQGTAMYHAFKTRLANDASLRSAHDSRSYCAEANNAFRLALEHNRRPFAELVSGEPSVKDAGKAPCTARTVVARRR